MEIIWLKMENIWLKMEAIWLKMEAIWLKMEVVWPPGARSRLVFTPNRRPMKKRMAPGTSREAPEDPEGPQKSIRNCLFAKKRALQTWIFVDFFAQGCFLRFGRVFSSIFDEKSMKNQRKKQCMFSVQCLFFWAWRPSRNIVFYNAKATFPVFVFLCFF